MSYTEVHDDDLHTYQVARRHRNRMRLMAESHYVSVAKEQRLYDDIMDDITDPADKEVTYTTSQVKEMLMDILHVGGIDHEFVRQRAGEDPHYPGSNKMETYQ